MNSAKYRILSGLLGLSLGCGTVSGTDDEPSANTCNNDGVCTAAQGENTSTCPADCEVSSSSSSSACSSDDHRQDEHEHGPHAHETAQCDVCQSARSPARSPAIELM